MEITEFNLPTIQVLFECIGDVENSSKFTLVKAAIATSIEPDKWQLVERGILQF